MRAVAFAGHLVVVLARDGELTRRHLVEGQRAGLIGADGGNRAQRLDRRQALDDGVLAGQDARAHRIHGGHHRRHAGRDGRNRQGDASRENYGELIPLRYDR